MSIAPARKFDKLRGISESDAARLERCMRGITAGPEMARQPWINVL
jgi:hypothetical protein